MTWAAREWWQGCVSQSAWQALWQGAWTHAQALLQGDKRGNREGDATLNRVSNGGGQCCA